jgi:hypothetical protein
MPDGRRLTWRDRALSWAVAGVLVAWSLPVIAPIIW